MRQTLVLIVLAGEVLKASAADLSKSLRQTKGQRDKASLDPDALATPNRTTWQMSTAPHAFWESLIRSASHMLSYNGSRMPSDVSLASLGSSSMLSERDLDRPYAKLSYSLPRHKSPAKTINPVDGNARSIQMAVGAFCCVFTVVGYIVGFTLLLVWWYSHPFKSGEMPSDDQITKLVSEKRTSIAHLGSTDLLKKLESKRVSMVMEPTESALSESEGSDSAKDLSGSLPERDRYHHIGEGLVNHSAHKPHIESRRDSLQSRVSVWEDEHVEIRSDELVDAIGISALCMFSADHNDGVERLPTKITVPLLFAQAAGLQLALLYFMWLQLRPRVSMSGHMPLFLVFVAIYLHFLNCVQEIPYAIQIFRHFVDFHESIAEVVFFGFVLIADAFIIPALCFILGALYLCTSTTVADVILNAVAVAFVREIDNWIIAFLLKISLLGGKTQSEMVEFPIGARSMQILSLSVVYIPVVPTIFSAACLWAGVAIFKL